jgi:hypothetical protein
MKNVSVPSVIVLVPFLNSCWLDYELSTLAASRTSGIHRSRMPRRNCSDA